MKQQDTTIKYFLYARKSSESEDRQMASIDSQIDELKKLAAQQGIEIVDTFSESKSAKEPGRVRFNEMLLRIEKGEARGILCWKMNRLARNPIDGGKIQWLLQSNVIQRIATFGRNYYPTDNVLMMAVELGMANQFIRDLSVDTKRGLRSKAERGYIPCPATLGYTHNPLRHKGDKEVIEDPERFPLVRKMFDLMLTGAYTPPQIWRIANNDFGLRTKTGKMVARSNIYRILNDPFYYGDFWYSGVLYHGKHTPMITREEYDRIQVLMGRRSSPKPQKHEFEYTGLIRCGECGAMITAENRIKRQKNGNTHHYTYYHCTKRKDEKCSQKHIRKEDLEKQFNKELESIEIPAEFRKWALEILKKENAQDFETNKVIIDSRQKAYNACLQKIDNLIDMRANKELSEDEFLPKKATLLEEKKRLLELLNDSDGAIGNIIEKADTLFTFAELARFRFETGTFEVKRSIIVALGSNLSLKDQKLHVSLDYPLLALKEAAIEARAISARFEPQKTCINKRTLADLYDQSPLMLAYQDAFRTFDWIGAFPDPKIALRQVNELLALS